MIDITEKEFRSFSEYIRSNYGINLKAEKQTLVAGRLGNIMLSKNFHSLSEYMDYVLSDPTGQAAITLIDRITTNHTFFMREPEHFRYFKEKVLPYLSETVPDRDLRIWSAACSSGEEPYTLAMVIDEFFGREKFRWDTKILATDLSTSILETAKKGIYSKERVSALPSAWRLSYFKEYDEENLALAEGIKNEVLFRKLNLMEKRFPFRKKFHVIFCRNVMIYFDNNTKAQLVEKFYDLTESGGYLFIGHSEALDRNNTRYTYVMPSVYRKG